MMLPGKASRRVCGFVGPAGRLGLKSGFGRELGMAALDGYSELKNVFFSTEV